MRVNNVSSLTVLTGSLIAIINNLLTIPYIILYDNDISFLNLTIYTSFKWKTIFAAFFLRSADFDSKYSKIVSLIKLLFLLLYFESKLNWAKASRATAILASDLKYYLLLS